MEVNDCRIKVELPRNDTTGWKSLSWGVFNGGLTTFNASNVGDDGDDDGPVMPPVVQVWNCKVPNDYDGVHPDPQELVRRIVRSETVEGNGGSNSGTQKKQNATKDPGCYAVGLLTAASMKTLSVASKAAGYDASGRDKKVTVDAVVTAGISNTRAVGGEADWFQFSNESEGVGGKRNNGTINTIVVTNARLGTSTMMEAHAVAAEARCRACSDMRIICEKTGMLAQGTGTDTTCLLARTDSEIAVDYAGKHTLFGEMVGQAVYEATCQSIRACIRHVYGRPFYYWLHKFKLRLAAALRGSRPMVPPEPLMPVPRPPISILLIGYTLLLAAYLLEACGLVRHTTSAIAAVFVWDRYLGTVPLVVHPVVLAGKLIRSFVEHTPERAFNNPVLAFLSGFALLVFALSISLTTASFVLEYSSVLSQRTIDAVITNRRFLDLSSDVSWLATTSTRCVMKFVPWIAEAMLLNSSISLQLLCTVALQEATFLERRQIREARMQLSWLCSRDSSELEPEDLAGGTLESLSENLSDSVVAPLFWYLSAGALVGKHHAWAAPLGALAFRVANTLDSSVGYRGRYEWFGKPSARFDDLLCLVPARATALLLALAGRMVWGCHAPSKALGVARSDASQCDSPNAGWPMATMAGLLGVRLEKKGQYRLNARGAAPGPVDIRRGQRVAQLAGYMSAFLTVAVASQFIGR